MAQIINLLTKISNIIGTSINETRLVEIWFYSNEKKFTQMDQFYKYLQR